MRSFSQWVLAFFISPVGLVVLAALDSTVFFYLNLGIDAAIVILAAQMRRSGWIVPLPAALGSVAGGALTFWTGMKVGEKGLDRYVPLKRLHRIRSRIRNRGAIALAVLDLIPPPFPFTAFVIAAGALEVKASMFFATLTFCVCSGSASRRRSPRDMAGRFCRGSSRIAFRTSRFWRRASWPAPTIFGSRCPDRNR